MQFLKHQRCTCRVTIAQYSRTVNQQTGLTSVRLHRIPPLYRSAMERWPGSEEQASRLDTSDEKLPHFKLRRD